ncbi:LRR receptor-like serine/threonine-protein kinase GSO1 [Durio zibethinus]|uniref:LRR receptor-like serine/threonine-protein kinase GSO1 n=1 Tax=Durio zibethinus TaxID=66656 RepID=A0A6P6A7V2_DURZI|nr:LRR receptor-like serine/threonine-protein kinase GSO1 [Durio zibethinus]
MATVIVLLIILAMADINFSNEISSSSNSPCIESEKQALLMFKRDLIDSSKRLGSWAPDHEDCCSWDGVVCDNSTGHVLDLYLGLPPLDDTTDFESYYRSKLKGKINPSLSNLKYLRYLDLSSNAFEGLLPYQLGNLSNLEYLNLGGDTRVITMGLLYVENLQWLSGLPLLKHLDLSFVNLSRASNWLQQINTVLPSLEELKLSGCQLLPGPPLPDVNLSSLAILDLSFNYFTNQMDLVWVSKLNSLVLLNLGLNDFHGPIPDVLRNMTSLSYLGLSSNYFISSIPGWLYSFSSLQVLKLRSNLLQGGISSAIGNMTSVNKLDLSENELEGELPRTVGNLCNLRSISLSGMRLSQDISHILEILSGCSSHGFESLDLANCQIFGQLTDRLGHFINLTELYLYGNSISGSLPTSLGQLANLKWVSIGNNLLEGVVSEMHFANHTKLIDFRGSGNSLILKVNPNWVPPFQLQYLKLRSWHIGPSFPPWLRSQKHLVSLDISNSRISDRIPRWFWRFSTQSLFLNLSNNQIYGQIEYLPKVDGIVALDLSFNHFSGPLPRTSIYSYHSRIDLSNNYFSGSLFQFLCYQLNDTMGTSILSLANNLLSGEIPDCWIKWRSLMVLRLNDNRFTGRIPSSMGNLRFLQSLNLYNNNLHGEIPLSLKNCTGLEAINLGENELDGNIPGWLGHSLPYLMILSLRSNKFRGNIPDHLCALGSLQILDLANNNLFGSIPRCVNNFSAMARGNGSKDSNIDYGNITGPTSESASVVMKGQLLEYSSTLNLVRIVDISCNNLSGEIPQEVTNLQGLQSLNLSHNHLIGKIPENIGGMKSLESLDLSVNQLSGLIPQSMSGMTFLSHLNVSCNNLTGQIPSSTQLQSFYTSSYAGNHLCGSPLEDCSESGIEPNISNGGRRNGRGLEVNWFYVSMALGFITGFWSILGPLVISRRWRFIYFRFLEQMWLKVGNSFCH